MAADTVSRFVSGFVVSKGVPITALLLFSPLLMAAGHLMLVRDVGVGMLYAACVFIGLSDGVCWSLSPLLVSKLFGLKSAGKIFGAVVLSAACFALLLSFWVQPTVYQKHAQNATDCVGDVCFATSHWVAAAFGSVAVVVSGLLHVWLTR
jgi:hypothetical protein